MGVAMACIVLLLPVQAWMATGVSQSWRTLQVQAPRSPVTCCTSGLPAPLRGADNYLRGPLSTDGTLEAWWRQDPQVIQFVVALPAGATLKSDVSIDLSRRRMTLTVAGSELLNGELAHDIDADASEWFVEDRDDLDDDFGTSDDDDSRFLVVDVKKRESFVNWPSPLKDGRAEGSARELLIGGKGEGQKQATAQQLASYQVLQKLPSATRGDVYARAPPDADGSPSTACWFVGKVIAEATPPEAALASQEVLVKEHARLYLPNVFGPVPDEDLELWLAPGNTELRVAQNEISLRPWVRPMGEDEALPAAGACGFEPETAPPEHMVGAGGDKFCVQRDANGAPIGRQYKANVVSPDKVPGTYEAWLGDR